MHLSDFKLELEASRHQRQAPDDQTRSTTLYTNNDPYYFGHQVFRDELVDVHGSSLCNDTNAVTDIIHNTITPILISPTPSPTNISQPYICSAIQIQ